MQQSTAVVFPFSERSEKVVKLTLLVYTTLCQSLQEIIFFLGFRVVFLFVFLTANHFMSVLTWLAKIQLKTLPCDWSVNILKFHVNLESQCGCHVIGITNIYNNYAIEAAILAANILALL